jgi:hypothetical protein
MSSAQRKGEWETEKDYCYEQITRVTVSDCSREVHVTVKDVNEYIPEWGEEEYAGQLEEVIMFGMMLMIMMIVTLMKMSEEDNLMSPGRAG